MKPEELIRKFGGEEGAKLQKLAENGNEEAVLLLEAARLQARDGYADLELLAETFDTNSHIVRNIIATFNSHKVLSFRLKYKYHSNRGWQFSKPDQLVSPHFEP